MARNPDHLPETVTLDAIVAPELPSALTVPAAMVASRRAGVFELRAYRNAEPELAPAIERVLERVGMNPTRWGECAWLIAFDSLSARERAWNLVNADPEWPSVRSRFDSYQSSLYAASLHAAQQAAEPRPRRSS